MLRFLLCAALVAVFSAGRTLGSGAEGEVVFDDLDAVVIEAADAVDRDSVAAAAAAKKTGRAKRQTLLLPGVAQSVAIEIGDGITGIEPVASEDKQACLTSGNKFGRCRSYNDCYAYFKTFSFTQNEQWVMGSFDTCTFATALGRVVTGVCCEEVPPKTEEEKKELVEKEEELLRKELEEAKAQEEEFPIEAQVINRQCGKTNHCNFNLRIVNGYETCTNEYPFMAAMMNRGRQFCSGSLIDKNHILTAAHCVSHMSKFDVQNLRVNLGDHSLSGKTEANHIVKKVKRVIRHKGFDSTILHNDVAILTLDSDVPDNPYLTNVQPLCLATDGSRSYANEELTVAGWGTTSDGGPQSDKLRQVKVNGWPNQKCSDSYGSRAPGGIISSMLCASTPSKNGNKDSCSGDSGGPLFKCRSGNCIQVGIVSWGIGCARERYPGVYTRVTSLLPWIKKIIAKY